MIPQSLDGGIGKKERDETRKTDSREIKEPDVLAEDEIDPADFSDPEEVGFRRNFNSARHE